MRVAIPPNANVPTARLLLAIKHKITGKVRFKARYVVGGHSDKLKSFFVHGSQSLQPINVLYTCCTFRNIKFTIWCSDVKLPYLQAGEPLQRKIFIGELAIEFDLEEDVVLQLIRPLYGLSDTEDLWYKNT